MHSKAIAKSRWRKGITKAMGHILGEEKLEGRIGEIKAIIERMDKRWDHWFVSSEDEYIQQRIRKLTHFYTRLSYRYINQFPRVSLSG